MQFNPYCPLGSYILSFQRSKRQNPPKVQIFLGVKKFIKNFIRDSRIWPILSFQGSYGNFHLSSDILWWSNIYKKIVSGTLGFDPYCPSKDPAQISTESSYFHGIQIFFQKIVSGTISFDPYCLFKDLIEFSI